MSIVKQLHKANDDEEKDEILEMLLFQRANIIKNSVGKYSKLNEVLNDLEKPIKSTIIYSSPQQIDNVMEIINNMGIVAHRFTENEGMHPEGRFGGVSQREYLLKNFSEGKYQILVALKCLDEGVNVPNAQNAVLMASSTNPREYIQRIGRVIRRYPGKEEASIYDIIVVPSVINIPTEWEKIEKNIFKKEMTRAMEIAINASNNAEAVQMLYNIKNQF